MYLNQLSDEFARYLVPLIQVLSCKIKGPLREGVATDVELFMGQEGRPPTAGILGVRTG